MNTRSGKAIFFSAILFLLFCGSTRAAGTKHYVLANNDDPTANTMALFELDPSTGGLNLLQTIYTGTFGIGGGYSAIPLISIQSSDRCVFVSDSGAADGQLIVGDIAAMTVPGFKIVGHYLNDSLNGSANGIGLAMSPNGQYLYAGYTGSNGLAVWQINSDCTLTLGNTYTIPGAPAAMVVAQQGSFQYMMVSYPDYNTIDLFTIGSNGSTLTEQPSGPVVPNHTPSGIDITEDGNVALVGDVTNPVQVETYWVSNDSSLCSPAAAPCLTGHQNFINLGKANNAATLWLSPQAWSTGTGCLYIANGGTFTVTPANFSEGSGPGMVTLTNGKPVRIPLGNDIQFLGAIQTVTSTGTGGGLYIAEYPNFIGTMKINADCSLVAGKATEDTSGASPSLLSIAAWPPR